MESVSEKIKIWFRFVPREGWFPQDTEGLWATRLGVDTACVQNAPFLQDGVAEGDVVRFRTDSDGLHWAVERISSSGNCTIRVVPVPAGLLGRSAQAVHQRLAAFGLGGEVFSDDFPMGPHRAAWHGCRWDQGPPDPRAGGRLVAFRGRLRH